MYIQDMQLPEGQDKWLEWPVIRLVLATSHVAVRWKCKSDVSKRRLSCCMKAQSTVWGEACAHLSSSCLGLL